MFTLVSLGITQFAADNPQFRPLPKNKNLQDQIKPNLEQKANPDLKLQTENELNSKTLLKPDTQLFAKGSEPEIESKLESIAANSTASIVKETTQVPEKLIRVYRGTDIYAENAAYDETGHLMSEATRRFYFENGRNVKDAYSQSEGIHSQWIKEFWGSEQDYVQAHGEFGTELGEIGGNLGTKRTLMSVTTDLETAKSFAGNRGRIYEALVPESSLIPQTISDAGESEYLIRFGSERFKWILNN